MRSAVAVANYFIEIAQRDGEADLSSPKLHGLVYLSHGWLLGASGQAVISGQVMAHRDGLFIPELKDAGCWGTQNVREAIGTVELDEARGVMVENSPRLDPKDPVIPALVWVWKTYGRVPSFRITQHLREIGSPWDLIWNDEERPDDEPKPVPNSTIRRWFRELTTRRKTQGTQYRLDDTKVSEQKPSLGDTQEILAQPDPNRLRTM